MAKNMFNELMLILIIQLFYSLGITLLTHSLIGLNPAYATNFNDFTSISSDIKNISDEISGSLEQQMNIPLIDLAALVFYSGNIIVDLILNFLFAIPSMVTLLLNVIFSFFTIDAYIASYLKLFIYSVISVIYFINLLAFLTNVRSRGAVV